MRAATASVTVTILLALGFAAFLPQAGNRGSQLAAQPPVAVTKNLEAKPVDAAVASVEDALNRRVDINFEETPLNQVVDFLSETYGVQFYLYGKKLEEAGIQVDTAITKKFKQIRLKTALDLILDELELTYVAKDDLIVITTPEDAESKLEVRVYDCRDLIAMPGLGEPGGIKPAQADAGTGAGPPGEKSDGLGGDVAPDAQGGILAGADADRSNKRPPLSKHDLRTEQLMDLIVTCVAPQSWDEVGGPGTMSPYNGLIVVSQTNEIHGRVERVLDMLREAANLEGGKVVR